MNKTVLITGASRGIGAQTAREFSKLGFNVAINYNSSKDIAQRLLTELIVNGGKAIAIKADVSNRNDVNEMFKEINNSFGGVDVLVNNAAISEQKLFSDITEEDWDKIFNINVKGMYNCIQNSLPYMINKKEGKIINISSIYGITGGSCEVHYSATKAAIIGMTKALAKELGLSNIQVNCVAPGVIETDMNAHLDAEVINILREETPLNRIGTPLDVANMITFLSSDKADFITGQVFSVNGGILI